MKRSRLLAVFVVALMIFAAVPVQVVHGQGAYTEKLNVFVAGSDALWYFAFGGVNGSSRLSQLESTPGLSWYNVTAIKATTWSSDFQVFGRNGYNILPVPFVPTQGMFLSVGSDSFSDASAAAGALDAFLLTHFVSLSNGTGTYSFYSPLSFDALVPSTFLQFLPSSEHGFSGAISSTGFASTSSPFVVLEGRASASGFDHGLVVGSISSSALASSGKPNLLQYYGSTITSLSASAHSSSSVIQFRFLDAEVKSSDSGAVVNNSPQVSGSYTLNLAPGKRVTSVNTTSVEQPAILMATRDVDVGVLRKGDNVSITLGFKNLSPTLRITNMSFTDDWWNKTGDFKFVGGDESAPASGIAAGASVTPVYRLQYIGTTSGSITIPASVVRYAYLVGSVKFEGTAVLNPIRLSLGADDAVVYAKVSPVGGLGKSIGATQSLNVTVTNVGTLPASSVLVAGHSIAGLAAKSGGSPGGTSTVTLTETANGLLGINLTKSYPVTYQDPGGSSLNVTTNVLSYIFSHISIELGYPTLNVVAEVSTRANQVNNATLTFSTFNLGPVKMTNFVANGDLPPGLGCGAVSGTGLSCSGGRVTISYPVLNASSNVNSYMKYNLTTPLNYLLGPLNFSAMTGAFNVSGRSNPAAIPGGILLSKIFTPSQLFGGMSSVVKVTAANSGPLPLYNVSVGSTADSFDTLASSGTLSKATASIGAGANATLSYDVTASATYGNLTGTPVSAAFYFGGTAFSVKGATPRVEIYQPLTVSISTTPSTPEEGKNFTISVTITNPSGVSVSNVQFTLPLPSGLGLSNVQGASVSAGTLTFALGGLAAHAKATATAAAVASSGITIPFDKAKLSFSYAGNTIKGIVPSGSGIAIAEDVTTRYLLPTALVLLVLLFTAYYVRKKAAPNVPASPK